MTRLGTRRLGRLRHTEAAHLPATADVRMHLWLAFRTRTRLHEHDLGATFVAAKPLSHGMGDRQSPLSAGCPLQMGMEDLHASTTPKLHSELRAERALHGRNREDGREGDDELVLRAPGSECTERKNDMSSVLNDAEGQALRDALDDEYRAWTTYDPVIRDCGPERPRTLSRPLDEITELEPVRPGTGKDAFVVLTADLVAPESPIPSAEKAR